MNKCGDCVFLEKEDGTPYCVTLPLYTERDPDDDACDDFVLVITEEEAAERDRFTRKWEPWDTYIGGKKVLTCPFCGSNEVNDTEGTGVNRNWHHVCCNNCGARGPAVKYMSAVEACNRRADDGRK